VADDKPYIALNSNEPLIWKPIVKAIEYCTGKGLKTSITTGAYSLPLLAEDLADAGLDRLNVSIDGPKDIHNFIRGRKDSFEKSLEGVHKFQARAKKIGSKAEVHLNAVISNMNYEHLGKMVDDLEQFQAQRISLFHLWFITDDLALTHNQYFGRQFPVSASCINEFTNPGAVDVNTLWQQLSEVQNKNANVILNPRFSHSELVKFYHDTSQPMHKNSKCMASWFFVQILADGSVIPYTRCHNSSFGDIYEQSFNEIWNGEKMKQWRSFIHQHKSMPMCNRCDLNY
jgi:radical SAM protein with 4Fe4S-binding SPASM domain